MLWYYLLIFLLTIGVIGLLASLIGSNWSKIAKGLRGNQVFESDKPHIMDKRPKYLIPELLKEGLVDQGIIQTIIIGGES